MSTAEMLHKEGLEQGLEQGLERGREEGIEQGSRAKAIETARNMLNAGYDLPTISQLTGLLKDVLMQIRDNSL